ncbi:hypothetical protein [Pseudomonas kuykendallii]|uniref:hypothetical protein n=1 Tax=Pseudomonas kuykendallii TaxID=1007099 RepID=UPI0023560F49|nr:hypothetical protein [Pseudomonas kuykendallii]
MRTYRAKTAVGHRRVVFSGHFAIDFDFLPFFQQQPISCAVDACNFLRMVEVNAFGDTKGFVLLRPSKTEWVLHYYRSRSFDLFELFDCIHADTKG